MHIQTPFRDQKWHGVPTSLESQLSRAAALSPLMLAAAVAPTPRCSMQQHISRLSFTMALWLMEYPHLLWDCIWVISGLKTSYSWGRTSKQFPWQQVERCRRCPHLTTISAFRRSSTVSANVGSGASCGWNPLSIPLRICPAIYSVWLKPH